AACRKLLAKTRAIELDVVGGFQLAACRAQADATCRGQRTSRPETPPREPAVREPCDEAVLPPGKFGSAIRNVAPLDRHCSQHRFEDTQRLCRGGAERQRTCGAGRPDEHAKPRALEGEVGSGGGRIGWRRRRIRPRVAILSDSRR